jgi:formate-dependent nitrite reductase membrane component NrfD
MSTSEQLPYVIAPHRFAVGFTRQTWWNWRIGAAFFFGEIGAGLFLVSLLTGRALGMAIGYLIVVVGKNTAHLLYLGRPSRFWRAAMRPDRSWIARGIWATGLFAISGLILLLPHFAGIELAIPSWGRSLAVVMAAASALFIMFYDGLVMKASPAIPFWNSTLLPVLCLTYATLGGVTLSLMLTTLQGGMPPPALERLEHWLLVINAWLLAIYILRMSRLEPAARQTVQLLLRGRYRRAFLGLVLLVGMVATLLLSLAQGHVEANALAVVIAACELAGDFTLLMVLLKSGLYSPQMARRSV